MKTIEALCIAALAAGFAISPAFAEKGEKGEREGKKDGKPGERHGKPGGERRGPPGGPGGFLKMMDKNEDGSISRAEFDAAQEKRVAHMKERLGDKFDLDQAADRANAMFTKLDGNGDGSISKEEAGKAREHFARRGGPGKGEHGKRGEGKRGKGGDGERGKKGPDKKGGE